MAVQLEIILIAGVVAVGLIVLGEAIMTGFTMSRRPSHHLAERTARRQYRQPSIFGRQVKERSSICRRPARPEAPRRRDR